MPNIVHHQIHAGLLVCLSLAPACKSPPAYVIVTVEDQEGLAAGATAIAYGAELNQMRSFEIAAGDLPLSFVMTSEAEKEVLAWIEARDTNGEALARGRTSLRFRFGKTESAIVSLATACERTTQTGQSCALADGSGNNGACKDGECKSWCGDSLVRSGLSPGDEGYEECDMGDGNSDILANTCRTNCLLPHCGDGVPDAGETCDDGAADSPSCNYDNGTGSYACTVAGCGDGYVNDYETCDSTDLQGKDCNDFGYESGTLVCSTGCVLDATGCTGTSTACGDAVIIAPEVCDDGNTADRKSVV